MRKRILLAAVIGLVVSGSAAASVRDSPIGAVLASPQGSVLWYFPHHAGTSRCRIPFVFARTISGTCTDRVAARAGNSGQILVNLSERWPWKAFHYSGTPRRRVHHHWVFDLLPSGKVVLVRQIGDFPPNDAR